MRSYTSFINDSPVHAALGVCSKAGAGPMSLPRWSLLLAGQTSAAQATCMARFSGPVKLAPFLATEATHLPTPVCGLTAPFPTYANCGGMMVRMMTPMTPTTLRFPDSLWQLVQEEAAIEGISASEFVRQSLLATVLVRRASADPQVGLNWARAAQEAREILWGNGT